MGKFWASGPGFWLYQSAFGSWIRVWWHQLWVRQDEFHRSLSMDDTAMQHMVPAQREKYEHDLHRRQQVAHQRAERRADHAESFEESSRG